MLVAYTSDAVFTNLQELDDCDMDLNSMALFPFWSQQNSAIVEKDDPKQWSGVQRRTAEGTLLNQDASHT